MLPPDEMSEVLVHLGVTRLSTMARTTGYFVAKKQSTMQHAILKLSNQVKKDTRGLITRVADAMGCIPVCANQTLCEQLNWLTEKSNQFGDVKLNQNKPLSSVACLPEMDSEVLRLFDEDSAS